MWQDQLSKETNQTSHSSTMRLITVIILSPVAGIGHHYFWKRCLFDVWLPRLEKAAPALFGKHETYLCPTSVCRETCLGNHISSWGMYVPNCPRELGDWLDNLLSMFVKWMKKIFTNMYILCSPICWDQIGEGENKIRMSKGICVVRAFWSYLIIGYI